MGAGLYGKDEMRGVNFDFFNVGQFLGGYNHSPMAQRNSIYLKIGTPSGKTSRVVVATEATEQAKDLNFFIIL